MNKKRILAKALKAGIIGRQQYEEHLVRLETSENKESLERRRFRRDIAPLLAVPAFLLFTSFLTAPKGGEQLYQGSPVSIKPRSDNRVTVSLYNRGALGYIKMYDNDGDGSLERVFKVTGGLPRGFIPTERTPGDAGFDGFQRWYSKLYSRAREKIDSGGFDLYEGGFRKFTSDK